MTAKPTGGPAFPSLNPTMTGIDSDGTERWETEPCGGLTMRDYFAAKAMQGMLANSRTEGTMAADVIDAAWAVADAMLEARR